jgi:hypothetical protein
MGGEIHFEKYEAEETVSTVVLPSALIMQLTLAISVYAGGQAARGQDCPEENVRHRGQGK